MLAQKLLLVLLDPVGNIFAEDAQCVYFIKSLLERVVQVVFLFRAILAI